MPSLSPDQFRRLATAAVTAHLAWEIATLLRARATAKTALRPQAAPRHRDAAGGAPVLHLLVPALREQPYVQRTVAAFAAVRDACPQASIWFVTTDREQPPGCGGETTKDIIERSLAAIDPERMAILNDPSPAGNKASQLNWAVAQLDRKRPGAGVAEDQAWIGVFDFDSQPHASTAAWVAAVASARTVEVIQVVPLGTTTLAGPPPGLLARSVILTEALHHACRSLGVERWKLDQADHGRRMPMYLVGAGMFIRRDALRAAGGFPFVDDVPLGYRLFLRGAWFTTVPVLNRVDLPDTIAAHFGSLKFIARGVVSWPSALAATRDREGARHADRLRLSAMGIADTAEMTVYPWVAAALTPGLLRRGMAHRILAIAWWMFPIAQTAVMRKVLDQELDTAAWRVPVPALAAASIARRFWRTTGAWRLAASTIRARLSGGSVTFAKQPRATSAAANPERPQ
ncbi:MAG TPA: glycosyltransferase family 2 protein [Streptosporangiaceae bacterium]|nr:glycosyltransferase family 2 protein [Streptosporangiaceae bacterium]HUZ27580.1 glycosyltransferase family 2 protein [Streptosporangiaceae bacterium]